MRSVLLSITEAEYIALSEVVKELKFIIQLLETINTTVEMPITIYVDNVGMIWLSNNQTTSERTKHVHIRAAFVKEYKEDGRILIKFVKSEDDAHINRKTLQIKSFKYTNPRLYDHLVYVVTCDVPSAFMQAEMDKVVHMKLEGELAKLLIKVDESYTTALTYEHGNPVIYTELNKALYELFKQFGKGSQGLH